MFEGFLKDWIIEDISHNLDTGQYGGQAGLGTEHMMVNFIDRIQYLLDKYPDKSAVIATSLDWAAGLPPLIGRTQHWQFRSLSRWV